MSKRRNKCPHCKGTGVVLFVRGTVGKPMELADVRCYPCAGTGTLTTKREKKP